MIQNVIVRVTLQCNKFDALEGSSETASATALFYLEKGKSLYPRRCFPDI